MEYHVKTIKTNPDGTVPFGRSGIRRPSKEFSTKVTRFLEETKRLGLDEQRHGESPKS
jgi:phosphoglucomutase